MFISKLTAEFEVVFFSVLGFKGLSNGFKFELELEFEIILPLTLLFFTLALEFGRIRFAGFQGMLYFLSLGASLVGL